MHYICMLCIGIYVISSLNVASREENVAATLRPIVLERFYSAESEWTVYKHHGCMDQCSVKCTEWLKTARAYIVVCCGQVYVAPLPTIAHKNCMQ